MNTNATRNKQTYIPIQNHFLQNLDGCLTAVVSVVPAIH